MPTRFAPAFRSRRGPRRRPGQRSRRRPAASSSGRRARLVHRPDERPTSRRPAASVHLRDRDPTSTGPPIPAGHPTTSRRTPSRAHPSHGYRVATGRCGSTRVRSAARRTVASATPERASNRPLGRLRCRRRWATTRDPGDGGGGPGRGAGSTPSPTGGASWDPARCGEHSRHQRPAHLAVCTNGCPPMGSIPHPRVTIQTTSSRSTSRAVPISIHKPPICCWSPPPSPTAGRSARLTAQISGTTCGAGATPAAVPQIAARSPTRARFGGYSPTTSRRGSPSSSPPTTTSSRKQPSSGPRAPRGPAWRAIASVPVIRAAWRCASTSRPGAAP